jgi:hypothetical protein
MSEHQVVAFRAIDGPVTDKNLDFMRQQSTRAEITAWSFDNEYHYGDFRGNAAEMLRRGYDFHFHYANFGIRKLMIRLPGGLPDAKAAAPYLEKDSLWIVKDKSGPGGILCIDPSYEPGQLEDLWDLDELCDRLLPLRAETLDGDLRPFYLAHLAVLSDLNHDPEKEKDGPIPAGLDKLTHAQDALCELYGLSEALIAAAAQNGPALPRKRGSGNQYEAWLQSQPDAIKNAWLARLMGESESGVRREILAEYRKNQGVPSWPTIRVDRTIVELMTAAEEIQSQMEREEAEKAARQRAKKLAEMAADPQKTLRATEKLVKQRTLDAYEQIAELLADLRAALSGSDQSGLAEQQARSLKDKNPTLRGLTAALRRQGFLSK